MRNSRLTGIFFKEAPTLLVRQLDEFFEHPKGPGSTPGDRTKKELFGAIVPFYKYEDSGPCAAWAYKEIAESQEPDVTIIFGQSEEGSGLSLEPYQTPLGMVRVNQKLARKILEKGNIKENDGVFDHDDFIESQLPFLQYVHGTDTTIKILPVMLNSELKLKELAVDIKEALLELGLKAHFIVPTNFTKHGALFQYLPFSNEVNKKVYALDEEGFSHITKNDFDGYLEFVHKHSLNTDNVLGLTMIMLLKPSSYKIEQYYTTADLEGKDKNVVSFASIILD